MIQDIVVMGATGKVGKTLINQILGADGVPLNRKSPVRIVGLSSSTNFLFSPDGISKQQTRGFISKNYDNTPALADLGEIVDEAKKYRQNSSRLVFVDVTALNEPMTSLHLRINGMGYGLGTANKNPIALSHPAVFQQLTEDPSLYGYRCSVMAGADAVPFLRDARYRGVKLNSIEGCFSGTLGYICSELEKGRKFSEILKEAKQQGYTEPDPRDDLNGLDVARKMIVLARTVGYNVEIGDIALEPFIPSSYFVRGESIEAFLDKSQELDGKFEQMVKEAAEEGKVLRYSGREKVSNGTLSIRVSLQKVPKDGDLGGLNGTANQIAVFNEIYPQSPYLIRAPGAGLTITASNVARDLLYLPGGMLHQNSVK